MQHRYWVRNIVSVDAGHLWGKPGQKFSEMYLWMQGISGASLDKNLAKVEVDPKLKLSIAL